MKHATINMVGDDVRSLHLGFSLSAFSLSDFQSEPPHVGSYHFNDHA